MASIDVHVHYVPDFYREAVEQAGQSRADGLPLPAWSVPAQLETMDRMGIMTSMLTVSSPGLHFGDDGAACRLARQCNECGADAVRQYPQRFGLLAALPVPDVDGSLKELEFACDQLHADGIKLPTHSQGIYLGHERLEPLFAELNRRQAVVVLHPQKPAAVPAQVLDGYPIPMMEFLFDTTRAVVNMMMTRTLERHPKIKFVVPHAGAFLSVLADRLVGRRKWFAPAGQQGEAPDIHEALRSMYYDLAGFPVPGQLFALLEMVGAKQLLYGSDGPFTPEAKATGLLQKLKITSLLTEEQRRAIFYENALRLFPRLAAQAVEGRSSGV